jgi:hypothetical protein
MQETWLGYWLGIARVSNGHFVLQTAFGDV